MAQTFFYVVSLSRHCSLQFLALDDAVISISATGFDVMPRIFADVDPRTLHLPPSRASGADPMKLQRQIANYGTSTAGMPVVCVYRCADGLLMIYDGVTRATRVAKLRPGTLIRVEVVGDVPAPCTRLPTVGDRCDA